MKRSIRRLLLALLIVILAILWQPEPTGPELVVQALWALDPLVSEATHAADPGGATPSEGSQPLLPVEADSMFVYADAAGQVRYRGRVSHRVALSESAFISYARLPGQLVVQDARGDFLSSIPRSGYPAFLADRLFVVSSGGGSLSEWTVAGSLLWQTELAAPLTVIDASATLAGIGLAAGGPLVLGADGEAYTLQRPAATIEPVVLAVAVSDEPARFAVVSGSADRGASAVPGGADPMATVTLYELSSGAGVPVLRRRITTDGESAPLVRLLDDGRVLLFSSGRGDRASADLPETDPPRIVAYEVETGDEASVSLRYPAVHAIDTVPADLKAILTVGMRRDPTRGFARPAELVLASRGGVVPVRASWAADVSRLSGYGDRIALTVDGRVLALRMTVE